MGVVWQARDELLSRDVAVKELVWPAYFSAAEQHAACRRATTEAQVAGRLSHRNVVRIFDIIEEDGRPWIVMELLPYGSLRDLIEQKGPLSPVQAAAVGLGILAALRAAHAEGIVHRDVKPANILIAPDRVVLADFGIARAAATSALTTTANVVLGSPSYIAPERARGGQSGPAGDLWGLGASLYAAVEGYGPFDRHGDALASLAAVVADEPEPTAHAGPLLSPVISGLLRKDPDQRLNATEAELMLRRLSAAPLQVTPATHQAGHRPRRSRGAALALAGSAALAVIAASGTAVGLALTNSSRPQTAPAAAIAQAAASTHTPAGGTQPRTHVSARTSPAHSPKSSPAPSTAKTIGSRAGNAGSRPAPHPHSVHGPAKASGAGQPGRERRGDHGRDH